MIRNATPVTPPPAAITGERLCQSPRAANTSPVTRSHSSSSLPGPSDGLGSRNPEPSDRQGSSSSEVAEEQLQRSPPDLQGSTASIESVISPTRRSIQQNNSGQQHHDPAGSGAKTPPRALKAWSFIKEKLVPICAILGVTLALLFGIVAWAGMIYANRYAKRQHDIALFVACNDYEYMRKNEFCKKIIDDGIIPPELAKRQEDTAIEEPEHVPLLISLLALDELLWRALSEIGSDTLAVTVSRVQESQLCFVFWTFPMSIRNGGNFPESHGLACVILESWRIGLFLGWQTILFGCSRYCFYACLRHLAELLFRDVPRGLVLQAFILPLLLVDVAHVLFSWLCVFPDRVYWQMLWWILLGLYFYTTLFQAIMLAANNTPIYLAIFLVPLHVFLYSCPLVRVTRVLALCCCSFSTFALWRGWEVDDWNVMARTKGWGLTAMVLILFGALLDLFHPNILTYLFYGIYCTQDKGECAYVSFAARAWAEYII